MRWPWQSKKKVRLEHREVSEPDCDVAISLYDSDDWDTKVLTRRKFWRLIMDKFNLNPDEGYTVVVSGSTLHIVDQPPNGKPRCKDDWGYFYYE